MSVERGSFLICVDNRRVVDLNIGRVCVWDRWGGASVAWWLVSRGCWDLLWCVSEAFSVCRLESQFLFSVRDLF
jgi:hypothetical protein